MNILITGGLGFIGSRLALSFLKENHRVFLVDNLSTNVSLPEELSGNNCAFYNMDLSHMDVSELRDLELILEKVDVVYHLAGSVGVKRIDLNPGGAIQNNYFMNAAILPLFERFQKKVIFGSTSEVYGETASALETDKLSVPPATKLRWGYAASKLMTEFLFYSYTFPFTVCRFFNVTGKGQTGKHGMVLPAFINKAKNGEPLVVHNQGAQVRCFCDIRDAVAFLRLLAREAILNREIVNVGNENNKCSIQELAEKVVLKARSSSEIIHKPFEEVYSNQTGEIELRVPNTEKMRRFYSCRHSLDDIIESFMGG